MFAEVTFSLGWTSGWVEGQDNEAYSWEMVEKMEKWARRLKQPVNFPVRAVSCTVFIFFIQYSNID